MSQLGGMQQPRQHSAQKTSCSIDNRSETDKSMKSDHKSIASGSISRLDRSNSSSQLHNDRTHISSSQGIRPRSDSVSEKLKAVRPSVSFLTTSKPRDSSAPPLRTPPAETHSPLKAGLSQFARLAQQPSNQRAQTPIIFQRNVEANGGVLPQSEPQARSTKTALFKPSLSDCKESLAKLGTTTAVKWKVTDRRNSKENRLPQRSKSTLALPAGRMAEKEDSFEEQGKVQALDHWDNERKQQKRLAAANRVFAAQKEKKEVPSVESKYLISPKLNQQVMNFIVNEEADDGRAGDSCANTQGGWRARPTTYQIQQDMNRKILNTILMNKMDKSLSKKPNESQNRSMQMNGDTLSNFKSLKSNLGSIAFSKLIDYDGLQQKIMQKHNKPKTMMDFTQFLRSKEEEEKRQHLTAKENLLLSKYQANAAEISQKKEMLRRFMLDTHNLNIEAKNCVAEIEDVRSELLAIDMRINGYRDTNVDPSKLKGLKRKHQKDFFNQVDEYKTIEKRKAELNQRSKELKEQTELLEKKIAGNREKMAVIESQIKDLKLRKSELRFEVKSLYLSMLKNESYLMEREDSLIYIINQLWKIREEVVEDYFPKYLNRDALRYLFEQAAIQCQLDQAAKFKESEEYKQIVGKYTMNAGNADDRAKSRPNFMKIPLSEATAIVQTRLNDLKKGIVNRKKPIFHKQMMEVGTRSNILGWEDMSDTRLNTSNYQEIDALQLQQTLEKFEVNLRQEAQKRQEQEIEHLYEQYANLEVNPKMLEEFCRLLLSLFGKTLGEKAHDKKAKLNHTYKPGSRNTYTNPLNGPNPVTMMMSYGTSFRKSAQKNQNVSDEQAEESKTKLDTQAETQQQFYRPILRPESRNVHSAQKSAFSEAPQFHNQEELSTLLGPTHSGKSSLSKTSTDFFRSRRNIRSASVTNKMVRVKEEPGDSSQQNSVEKPRVLVKSHSSVKVGQYTQEMARMQKVEAA